ncbi:oligosaccharide flippase family protein [Sphingorhabdus sp.]|uniref:oligosaccharide flippase family protein n=1 Tax=Sphingorhabdus sp. TaxID=1902408 RepID=UPI00391BF54E
MNEPIPALQRASMWRAASVFVKARLGLFGTAGWVTVAFMLQQVVRLGSSIILAWLLAPALLGTMLLINTLRTGVELLTDVGVGQSIVNNPRGNDPSFYNTAWTIQIIRGVILTIVALALSVPVAKMYDNTALIYLLPFVAPIFIIAGFMSPSRFLLQKRMEVGKVATFDLVLGVVAAVVQIALAAYSPTIWALIWGLLITTAIWSAASFYIIDWRDHRLHWDMDAAKSILHFGKWIFLSTLIYFLAMNFDRLYFADAIPIALLGVYGIARTFSETVMQLFQRISNLLIFPKISASLLRGADLRRSMGPMRMVMLLGIAAGLAVGISFADEFIFLVYDDRYRAAGFFLTVLLFGTWFAILAAISDAMMMGVGKPSGVAISNGAKLAVIVALLPFLLATFGINAALAVFVFAEMVRYAALMWLKRKQGIGFARQDVIATVVFIILAFAFRELTMLVGLTGGVSEWITQASMPHV